MMRWEIVDLAAAAAAAAAAVAASAGFLKWRETLWVRRGDLADP